MNESKADVSERLSQLEKDWKGLVDKYGRTVATLDELHLNFEALEGAAMEAVASMRAEVGELQARSDYEDDAHLRDVAEGLKHAASELERAIENPPGDDIGYTYDTNDEEER